MLQLVDNRHDRRSFMKIGTSFMGGLSLTSLLAAKAEASLQKVMRNRSVIVLNLQGGPTQFETFDPKMAAPVEIRSITGEIPTSLPGVTFGGTLPLVAKHAHEMAVVRSYRHGISSHGEAAKHVMAGGNATGAMMGALFAHVAGLTNISTGMPNNCVVTSQAIDSKLGHLYKNTERVSETGSLPSSFKPFDPSAGGDIVGNMRLQIDQRRLNDRRSLLHQMDLLRRQAEIVGIEQATRFEQQAFDVLLRGAGDAFDLEKEDPRLLERYDTSAMEPSASVKGRNEYAKQFSPVALGKQLLLARRLCEAGCGFVTVTAPGWDMHGGGKEFTMQDGLTALMPALDKAVSAYIEDVQRRGLMDDILLVITGEFGRTPKINKVGGRDHWGNLCTLAFVGGGLKMGQVVGRSDRIASEPDSTPISSGQVLATIMHTLFDIGELRLLSGIPRDVQNVITNDAPIEQLV